MTIIYISPQYVQLRISPLFKISIETVQPFVLYSLRVECKFTPGHPPIERWNQAILPCTTRPSYLLPCPNGRSLMQKLFAWRYNQPGKTIGRSRLSLHLCYLCRLPCHSFTPWEGWMHIDQQLCKFREKFYKKCYLISCKAHKFGIN